ncbi:MAG: hypothetical protein U0T84_04875 [Chitinophagales bacterium]
MEKVTASGQTYRWLLLVAIIGNVLFNFLYTAGPLALRDIRAVTYDHPNYFIPAGYAFSIWGLIYSLFLSFGIFALLPAEKSYPGLNALVLPLIAVNVLGSVWIAFYTREVLGASVVLLLVQLALGVYMMFTAHQLLAANQIPRWNLIPFGVYAGWVSVATIANVAIYLVSVGWRGGEYEVMITMTMLMIAAALAVWVSFQLTEPYYALVICWAAFAIYVEVSKSRADIGYAALATAAVAGLAGVLYLVKLYRLNT